VSRKELDELKQQIPLRDYLEAHDWRPMRRLSRARDCSGDSHSIEGYLLWFTNDFSTAGISPRLFGDGARHAAESSRGDC
jgi:hypothetical protein